MVADVFLKSALILIHSNNKKKSIILTCNAHITVEFFRNVPAWPERSRIGLQTHVVRLTFALEAGFFVAGLLARPPLLKPPLSSPSTRRCSSSDKDCKGPNGKYKMFSPQPENEQSLKQMSAGLTLRNLFISISYSFFLWKSKHMQHLDKSESFCSAAAEWMPESEPVHSVSGRRPSHVASAASTSGCTSSCARCWERPSCWTSAPHKTWSNRF